MVSMSVVKHVRLEPGLDDEMTIRLVSERVTGPWRMGVEAPGFAPFSAGFALAPRERRPVNVSLDRLR